MEFIQKMNQSSGSHKQRESSSLELGTDSYGLKTFTARELRSLRGIRSPHWLQVEPLSNPPQSPVGYRADRTWSGLFRLIRSRVFGNGPVPVLEGKSVGRHHANPLVIVAVGEYEAFCHLPRVGTHWRSNSQTTTVLERRAIFRQAIALISILLQPSRIRTSRPNLAQYLPYPPLTLSEQRRCVTLQEGRGISPQLAKLLAKSP